MVIVEDALHLLFPLMSAEDLEISVLYAQPEFAYAIVNLM
jgi:hypothetical protein